MYLTIMRHLREHAVTSDYIVVTARRYCTRTACYCTARLQYEYEYEYTPAACGDVVAAIRRVATGVADQDIARLS